MREIKFRAWDIKNKMMYEIGRLEIPWTYPDIIIMQFTGLYDIHDKEIYEGDLVSYPVEANEYNKKLFNIKKDFIGKTVVVWDEENAYFEFRFDPDKQMHPLYQVVRAIDEQIEVIGNIYENPELIT